MKIFTLYNANGIPVAQTQVFGNDSATPPDGYVDTTDTPSIVATPVPDTVSATQVYVAMQAMPSAQGNANFWTDINNGLTAQGGAALVYWQKVTEFNRTNATLAQLGAALGITPAQMDALFIAAGNVKV